MYLILGHGAAYNGPHGIRCSPIETEIWTSQPHISMDREPAAQPDVLHDVTDTPWPFADACFDGVVDTVGHLGPFARSGYRLILPEIDRVLKPGGAFYGWEKGRRCSIVRRKEDLRTQEQVICES
jgi:SAM-dependent methyltransferase